MKRIDLKTGFLCNNNCRFCVQAHKKKFGNRDTDELKRCLSDAAREGYESVVFTGGEVTIRPDVIDLVRYAKASGFKVIQIQTNGRRFSDIAFCQECIAAGVNQFNPALHGHNPEVHDYLTRSDGAFMQTVRGIRNLKKLNQMVMTNTVITKTNYRYLPHIALLLTKLHVDQFQLAFVHAMGNALKNFDTVVPRKLLVAPYVKQALDIGIAAGIGAMTEAIPYCLMKGYERYVAEDKIPDTKIFDLNAVVENFTDVRRAYGKVKAEQCRECKYFEKCEGPWREYPEHFGWREFIPVK
jgi:MoaA/NifB/PqqE/SkfB family radical SAM enzyme